MQFIIAYILLSHRDWVGQVSKHPIGVVNMYLASHVFMCLNEFISLMSLSWKGSITDALFYMLQYITSVFNKRLTSKAVQEERYMKDKDMVQRFNLPASWTWCQTVCERQDLPTWHLCVQKSRRWSRVNESLSSTESHGSVFRQVITNQPDLIRHVLFNDNVNYAMRLF